MIIKKLIIVPAAIMLLFCAISTFYFFNKSIMFTSNMERCINNFWNNKVSIRVIKDFELNGKKFKLILSTPINNEKYLYLNCFEEKVNGLYYKSYQAAEQGGSNAQFSFSTVFVNDGSNKENYFTMAYGYNKDFQVSSYEIKFKDESKDIVSDVSGKDYFIDAYKGSFPDIIKATGKDGSNKINVFYD